MANIRSAEKRNRQATKRRERNRAERSKLRTAIKRTRASIEQAESASLSETFSVIDKAAKHNVIKKNTANRYKSRLAKQAKRSATQS